jgi:hypothetical protein
MCGKTSEFRELALNPDVFLRLRRFDVQEVSDFLELPLSFSCGFAADFRLKG